MSKFGAMRFRLIAATVAALVLATLGALVAPASATPPSYGTCKINREYIGTEGDYIVIGGGSGRPIECYY